MKIIKTKKIHIPFRVIESDPKFNDELSYEETLRINDNLIQNHNDMVEFYEVENNEHISGPELNDNHKKNEINMIPTPLVQTEIMRLDVKSKSFQQNEYIPRKHTCDGVNISPSLDIAFLPNSTVSLAILVEDPDAPINSWVHWLVWNIPPIHHIPEHCKMGISGMNDFSKNFYCGPCPISGIHNYSFKVYALNTKIELTGKTRRYDFLKAIENHIVAFGELNAKYGRKKYDRL